MENPPPWHVTIYKIFKSTEIQKIKNAYALKTPCVVALPFIYGVKCIIIPNKKGSLHIYRSNVLKMDHCLLLMMRNCRVP